MALKNLISNKHSWILLFCFAVIFGPAFTLFNEYGYDLSANPDITTYLKIAELDFNDSPVRRYRIIIPLLASGINFFLEPLIYLIKPWNFPGPDFSLGFSFLLINCLVISLAGLLLFRLLKAFSCSDFASITGVLLMLSCRWTAYFAGLPLVDSLYFLVVVAFLLAFATGNTKLFLACLFVGPWAKESFLLFFPLFLFFCPLSLKKLLLYSFLSWAIYFAFRYWVDTSLGSSIDQAVSTDLEHFFQIKESLKRLFSFHGIYEFTSIFGVWGLAFVLFFKKGMLANTLTRIPRYYLLFFAIVLLHALLSTELARMFYLLTPLFSILLALLVDSLSEHFYKKEENIA